MKSSIIIFVILSVLLGCSKDYSDLPQIEVEFRWPEKKAYAVSPEVLINGVPAQVKRFQVNMFDLDNRYDHGGGEIANDGSGRIAEGALKKYEGPGPMYGAPRYRLAVKALDDEGQVIAYGEKTHTYPPENK